MLGRTAIKVAGAGLGAYAGNKLSNKAINKLITKKQELDKIPLNKLTRNQAKERISLGRKIKAAQYIGTGAGAYLGYKGSKKLAIKTIKLD